MAAIGEDGFAIGGIPDLYGRIPGAGGDLHAIGRPAKSLDAFLLMVIDLEEAAGVSVPNLDGAIFVPGRDAGTIGRPGYGPYPCIQTMINQHLQCCRGVPDLDGLIE